MHKRRQSPIVILVALLLIPFIALRMCSRSRLPVSHPAQSIRTPLPGGRIMPFTISSSAFSNGSPIAARYTCDGADLSPALTWSAAPDRTQSLALIADDPDAPMGTWTHWLLWNIPARATLLSEDVPKVELLDNGARQGINDFQRIGYGGPCPPPGKPHRYFFKLYALDARLDLKPGATKSELERAIAPHILAQAQTMGTYGR
jgi:Raf kinase inhibitor-like YbhB/YbcL family protein